MKIKTASCILIYLSLSVTSSNVQGQGRNLVLVNSDDSLEAILQKAVMVTPSTRQLEWQQREFTAFVHFGLNTFTNKEWSDGKDDAALFNPTAYDPGQWIRTFKSAGISMVILTAKHHDGFCLWPSAFTDYSVKSSPWKQGKGDVIADVSSACHENGLKFGVYVSPWDRHEASYGDSPRYNQHFRDQLGEILTHYGEIDEVWFDGACGEGPNGKRQVYDWISYYKVIRKLQPNAVIAIMGPDVRWVGTESGYGRDTEWSVLPDYLLNKEALASATKRTLLEDIFIPKDLMLADLGSREKLRGARALVWYPAETDVSIRNGWFYHKDDDATVKSPEKLVDIYFNSVGKNSVLLLNIPPDTRGLINEKDIKSLEGMRHILDETFGHNLAKEALISEVPQAGSATSPVIFEYTLDTIRSFDVLMLQEDIRYGQRIEQFHAEAWDGSGWREFTRGTTVGYKRLLRFPLVRSGRIRFAIDQSRAKPILQTFGLFQGPVEP